MGYSKRQFVEAALTEIGLASYPFDAYPEQMETALRRLDAMIETWNGRGVRIGYAIPGSPQNSDLDTPTGVPDWCNEAIITELAIRLAPSFGKTISVDTRVTAKQAFNTMLARSMQPPQVQLPGNTPLGAGNKPWRWFNPFVARPARPVLTGGEGPLEFD